MYIYKFFNKSYKKILVIIFLITASFFVIGEDESLSEVSFINKDLTGANLTGVDLRNLDFTAANLSGVDLSNQDLTGVILNKANLSGVNFTKANLTNAELKDANLQGATLDFANLSGASLSGAYLIGGKFRGANLTGVDLRNLDFTEANLSWIDFSNQDLTGAILTSTNLAESNFFNANLQNTILIEADLTMAEFNLDTDLRGAVLRGANLFRVNLDHLNLSEANFSEVDFSNKDLNGTILTKANLSGVNFTKVNLQDAILIEANLTNAELKDSDLRKTNFTGAIFTGAGLLQANFSDSNLTGVDLRSLDLTAANLSGVDLSNQDLTGTILKDALDIVISVKNSNDSNWPTLANKSLNITRYELSGEVQYIITKEGFIFQSKNNEVRLVLDLNDESQFPYFSSSAAEAGLLGIAVKNNLIYISYTNDDGNGLFSLVVDELSIDFSKVRNIIKIKEFQAVHFGGALNFDSLGRLYLSVGDGSNNLNYDYFPQDLNDKRGKILRIDIMDLKLEPEVVAYGIRNPWGVSIDSKDRMFILQCGWNNVEGVALLNDLDSKVPANLGWPVFEQSVRMKNDPLKLKDVLAPIYENIVRPGCLTAGIYLDDVELFLFGDFYGTIRLLKQKENGDWYLLHEYKQNNSIWGFGLDKKTKKIFITPNNLELELSLDQVKRN